MNLSIQDKTFSVQGKANGTPTGELLGKWDSGLVLLDGQGGGRQEYAKSHSPPPPPCQSKPCRFTGDQVSGEFLKPFGSW